MWRNLLGGLLDGVIDSLGVKQKMCVEFTSITRAWLVGGRFAFHIMLSGALRQEDAPEYVLLDRRQNASSDSIPPSSIYYKRLMYARCHCRLCHVDQTAATPSETRHVFITCACSHVLHPFFLSSLGLLDLSSSAGASPFSARFSVFLMVSFVLSSSFFCSLSSACCLF